MKKVFRLLQIQHVLLKYGLDRALSGVPKLRWARLLLMFVPWVLVYPSRRRGSLAQRSKLALVELGPIFIKFGQMLSTRRDLLNDDFSDELSRLQDKVPPFTLDVVKQRIQAAYGKPAEQVFAQFNETPLASASIAQVHAATLLSGESVVVKVLRPNVQKRIELDVSVMHSLAKLAHAASHEAKRLRMVEVVKEYEKTIIDELDLVREAANGSQLKRNFEGSESLYVPKIHWEYATEKVIVMERIRGLNIADMALLKSKKINLKKLAERGVEIFFTQVFKHNFFHADMHPGNIFVSEENPNNPKYMCVDFGIIGSLSEADQRYLGENLLAFFRRDYKRVAQLHIQSGWMNEGVRLDEFESAVRSACEPIFEKPLAEISFGTLLMRLFKISQRYGYEVQPQLVLLQKTLLNIEGLGRQLYPQLDLWDTAQPFLEEWMRETYDPRHALKALRDNAPQWVADLPDMPIMLKNALTHLSQASTHTEQYQQALLSLQSSVQQEHKRNRRLALQIVLAAAALGGALFLPSDRLSAWHGIPWLSWVFGASAVLLTLKK